MQEKEGDNLVTTKEMLGKAKTILDEVGRLRGICPIPPCS